jgi:arylsulfatase A-like enzyme/Flp pilus assembly protein TadD
MSRRERLRTPAGRSASGPRRRRRAIVVAASLLALSVGGIAVWRGDYGRFLSRPAARPNVLLITIDTLRWDHVGCYGSTLRTTPILDRLAASGARFETAIMHAPLTAPSHASILTSLIPLGHGVRDNGAFAVPTGVPTLATTFKDAGYLTAAFVSGFPLDRRFGFARGFDTYDDRLPRGSGPGMTQGAPGAPGTERRADATTARAIAWIDGLRAVDRGGREHAGGHWFLWVHYFDPHAAYDPPLEWRTRVPGRPYDGEIAFVDQQIGRLAGHLDRVGALDNTVVLVTADHGESLGEHGEETHGVFVYDATLRVPWIVSGPGVRQRRVQDVVARGIDVMPTLLDLAGVPLPKSIDGRSLRPALNGRGMDDEPAYIESLLSSRHFGWASLQGVRTARWKYIAAPSPELYDLAADTAETANAIGAHRDRASDMSRELEGWLRGAPARAASRPRDRNTEERLSALGYIARTPTAPVAPGRDPKSAVALINRLEHAIAQTRTDPRLAVEQLRSVLAEDSGLAIARSQMAAALSALGDHHGVIEQIHALQAAGAAGPEDLLLLSESLRILGQGEAARQALREGARLDPLSPEPALTEARGHMAARQPHEAAAAYRRALELAPDHPEALNGLGEIALLDGDLPAAGGYFERVLSLDPADARARTRLGMIRGREGRFGEAVALLHEVVEESPADGEALAGLAAALARSGAPGAAVPYFQRAVAAGVRTPAVLNGLGFARLEAGDRAGALAALRASLAIEANQPGVARAVRDLSGDAPPVTRRKP